MNNIKYYDDYLVIDDKKFPILINEVDTINHRIGAYWLGGFNYLLRKEDYCPQIIADIPETECLSVENLQPVSLEVFNDMKWRFGKQIDIDLEFFKLTRYNVFNVNPDYTELWNYLQSKVIPNLDAEKVRKYSEKLESLDKDFE